MKKLLFALVGVLGLTACGNHTAKEAVREEMMASQLDAKDSLMGEVLASINQIAANLTFIQVREEIIGKNLPDFEQAHAQINEDIAAINHLIRQCHYALEELYVSNETWRQSHGRMVELEVLADNLTRQIDSRCDALDKLNDDLMLLPVEVVRLETVLKPSPGAGGGDSYRDLTQRESNARKDTRLMAYR